MNLLVAHRACFCLYAYTTIYQILYVPVRRDKISIEFDVQCLFTSISYLVSSHFWNDQSTPFICCCSEGAEYWRIFQHFWCHVQVSDDANVILNGFGTVVNSLKMRAKPYLPQICGTIKWRLNNKNAKIRQQAADLIARIAIVMKVISWVTSSFVATVTPFLSI